MVKQNNFACLTYHAIGEGSNQYELSERRLRAQLALLHDESYTVEGFAQLEARLRSGQASPADYAQPSLRGVTLMVRGMPGVDILAALQREISATDANVTPFNARSMSEQIAEFTSSLRSGAWTWNLIGAFGMILAAVGLAGVTAYSVAQRGHEIGIRMALGAQKSDVLGLVMKEGAVLTMAGTLIGMALTWAGLRLMSGLFFSVASVQAFDPALLVGAPLLLAALALAACYVPARKSMRIDPAIALRQE